LSQEFADRLNLAARAHDLGKAHPVFAAAIRDKGVYEGRVDLAKAPSGAWHAPSRMYAQDKSSGSRRGFRHELASALALMELLRRVDPMHDALLGRHGALLEALRATPLPLADDQRLDAPKGLVAELAALDGPDVDLVLWLVCTHHGKVRASWQATPSDQDWVDRDGRGQPLRGVRDGDMLPALVMADATGSDSPLPSAGLHLDAASLGLSPRYGASWGERVAALLDKYGPFTLALLETLLRVADVRASRLTTEDPRLGGKS
jgi:CRISPR-associated endonuclease/helicase Cas3